MGFRPRLLLGVFFRFFGELLGVLVGVDRELESLAAPLVGGQMVPFAVGFGGGSVGCGPIPAVKGSVAVSPQLARVKTNKPSTVETQE